MRTLLVSLLAFLAGTACGDLTADETRFEGSGTLDASGGQIEARDATIIARPGAVEGSVHVQVSTVDLPRDLPAGLQAVGKAVDIKLAPPGQLNGPIQIRMSYDPANIPYEEHLVVLHDKDGIEYEPVSILAHDLFEHVITFESRTFSSFVLAALPGQPPDQVRLEKFSPSTNGWPIQDFVHHLSDGTSLGMAAYAAWFYGKFPFDRLHEAYPELSSQILALRTQLAMSLVLPLLLSESELTWQEALVSQRLVIRNLKAYLHVMKTPLVVLMNCPKGSHAVVAYGYDQDRFSIYDPSFPREERSLSYSKLGVFDPYRGNSCFNDLGLSYKAATSLIDIQEFEDLTTAARNNFASSETIGVVAPAEGEEIDADTITVRGSVQARENIGPDFELLAYSLPIDSADTRPGFASQVLGPVNIKLKGPGSFEFDAPLVKGENHLLLLGGVRQESACSADVCDKPDPSATEPDRSIKTSAALNRTIHRTGLSPEEICDNGIDDDGDNLTDCLEPPDPDCECQDPGEDVCDAAGAEEILCGQTRTGTTQGGSNRVNVYTDCSTWNESGPEKVYVFHTETGSSGTVHLLEQEVDLDVFVVKTHCSPDTCKASGSTHADFTWEVLGDTYYIIVDGYRGVSGSFKLFLDCR